MQIASFAGRIVVIIFITFDFIACGSVSSRPHQAVDMSQAADLGQDGSGAPADLAQPSAHDLAVGGISDIGVIDAGGAKDLAATPSDFSVGKDLAVAVGPDLAVGKDLSVSVDLAVAHDLTVGPDLAGPPDLTGVLYTSTDPLQVDLSSIFNADTVANAAPTGQSYPPLVPMDGSGYDFLTESVAEAAFNDGAGLPVDGLFAANANHPKAQLAFNDSSVALNSAILNNPPTPQLSATFPIVNTQFSALQLYCTSTEGSSAITVTLNYSDSSTDLANFTVPDWFQSLSAAAPVFVVQSGLSRFSLSSGDDFSEGAALYGASVVVNSAKTLTSVTVKTTATSGRLVIYGATAY